MRLKAYLELTRPQNCVISGAAAVVGALVASGGELLPLMLFVFGAAAMICAGGNAVNDYCDRAIDAINRPSRPIPSGRIAPSQALGVGKYLLLVGVILALPLGLGCVALAVFNSLLLAVYSAWLKRWGLPGNLAIAYLVGSTFLFGGLAVGRLGLVGVLALMAALSTAGRELIKDIEDMRGDKRLGLRTFPLTHGPRAAAWLAAGFLASTSALAPLPYAMGLGRVYLVLVLVSIGFFGAASALAIRDLPKGAGRASRICRAGMGWGVLAFLAGAL